MQWVQTSKNVFSTFCSQRLAEVTQATGSYKSDSYEYDLLCNIIACHLVGTLEKIVQTFWTQWC